MREEVISSGGTIDPTPAASSAGASSPAVPTYVGSIDLSGHGHGSKAASLSCVGSQQPRNSLSTSVGGSALASSRPSCRPWERGDLLRRLATFKPSYWFGKPKVANSLACAQRGWMNVDVDKIACESCGACLNFVLLPSWSINEGHLKGESNYEEAAEFDPIIYHDQFCPWVNGNVAAAGCSNSGSGASADAIALSGWQLTLDALDTLRSFGHMPIPPVQSESAASLYKDDNQTPGGKLLQRPSVRKSHGQHPGQP